MHGTRKAFCEPANTVIEKLGGTMEASIILQVSRAALTQWRTAKNRSCGGGVIPRSRHAEILAYSHKHGLGITPEMLAGGSGL